MFSKNLDGIQTTSISGIGNETGRFYLGFQENFESCDQNDLGFQESGQEAGAAGTDCSNLHFHRPRCSPFFWNPAPLMQNYMIKSVKMTKKSILRDQFSWKVRNFAQNLCENGLHLGKEQALCTRFAPPLSHAFRKGCRSFCCSISPTNYHLARRKNEQIMYNGVMRTSADFALVHDGCGRPVGDKVWGLRFLYAHTDSASPYQTLMREL